MRAAVSGGQLNAPGREWAPQLASQQAVHIPHSGETQTSVMAHTTVERRRVRAFRTVSSVMRSTAVLHRTRRWAGAGSAVPCMAALLALPRGANGYTSAPLLQPEAGMRGCRRRVDRANVSYWPSFVTLDSSPRAWDLVNPNPQEPILDLDVACHRMRSNMLHVLIRWGSPCSAHTHAYFCSGLGPRTAGKNSKIHCIAHRRSLTPDEHTMRGA